MLLGPTVAPARVVHLRSTVPTGTEAFIRVCRTERKVRVLPKAGNHRLVLLPKLAFFSHGTVQVMNSLFHVPEWALPSGSCASVPAGPPHAAATTDSSLGTRPVTAADLQSPPSPRTEIKHKAYDPQYESSEWQSSCPPWSGAPDDQGADKVDLDAPIHVHSDGSEPELVALSGRTTVALSCGARQSGSGTSGNSQPVLWTTKL